MRQHPLLAAWDGYGEQPADYRHRRVFVHDGMVIKGWPLYKCLRNGGHRPNLVSIGGRDPVEFVLESVNSMPNGKPKTLGVAKCALWLPPGRPSSARIKAMEGGMLSMMTAELIAKKAGVSVRSVVRCKAELRAEEQAVSVDWKARCHYLEGVLDQMEMEIQQYADVSLKPKDMLNAMKQANLRNRAYRERMRNQQNEIRELRGKLKKLESGDGK